MRCCVAQRKHSCLPPSSPGFASQLHPDFTLREFFSLLISFWTVLRSNPSSAKQWISQMQLAVTSIARYFKKHFMMLSPTDWTLKRTIRYYTCFKGNCNSWVANSLVIIFQAVACPFRTMRLPQFSAATPTDTLFRRTTTSATAKIQLCSITLPPATPPASARARSSTTRSCLSPLIRISGNEWCFYRSQTVLIKLVSPQDAPLGFHFHRKNRNGVPSQGTCLRTHYCG